MIIVSILIANSIIIVFSSDSHRYNKHSITLLILNITAAIASSLGIFAVYRHGIYGIHGKSYLFLTLGIISWFSADLTLAYYYFVLGIEQQILFISVADVLWFVGYAFLESHLFIVLRFIRTKINLTAIIVAAIATMLFISYNIVHLISLLSSS